MIKVTLLLGSLFVLGTAALFSSYDSNLVDGCQSKTELWPSIDGTKFYVCLYDNVALEQTCDPGTFFVKNDTVSGCVPLDLVDDSCIYHDDVQPCEGENLLQPQTCIYPTKYFVCLFRGAQPIALNCPENKAFVKERGYLGCFPWSQFREIRGCSK